MKFELEGSPAFEGQPGPTKWNGFETPSFDFNTAQQITDWLNSQAPEGTDHGYYQPEADAFIFPYDESEWEEFHSHNGRYSLGAFSWCWTQAEENPDED